MAKSCRKASEGNRRLVLHFDINETIMIADPATNVDFTTSLNHVIAKMAIVRSNPVADDAVDYVWHDGSPLDVSKRPFNAGVPPLLDHFKLPLGCHCFFEVYRQQASRFTETGMPGEIYRPVVEECVLALQWRHAPKATFEADGYHRFLPAFFHTLRELARQGRDFAVVIRTFGVDLPNVVLALTAFADGLHPDYPIEEAIRDRIRGLRPSDADALWALRRADRSDVQSAIQLCHYEDYLGDKGFGSNLSKAEVRLPAILQEVDESSITKLFTTQRVLCIRDDYFFWKGHECRPEAGKPLWLTVGDSSVQHIFFDDNIHDKADDSIVAVRVRSAAGGSSGSCFHSVSGDATRQLEGCLLVKTQPAVAIRSTNYVLDKIRQCEESFTSMLQDGSLRALLQPAEGPSPSPTAKIGMDVVLTAFRAFEKQKGAAIDVSELADVLRKLLKTNDTQIQQLLTASGCLPCGHMEGSASVAIDDFVGWVFSQMQAQTLGPEVVFVLGSPGCGKGTFCAKIVEKFGYRHLSTKDLLKAERARPDSEVGALIESRLKESQPVPSAVMVGLFEQEMCNQAWEGGKYLVEGFPRSADDANAWDQLLGQRVHLKFCLVIEYSEACMERRLLYRRQGSGRLDDNIETIRRRFLTFKEESIPVIQRYEDSGLVKKVNSERGIESVWHEVEAIFGDV